MQKGYALGRFDASIIRRNANRVQIFVGLLQSFAFGSDITIMESVILNLRMRFFFIRFFSHEVRKVLYLLLLIQNHYSVRVVIDSYFCCIALCFLFTNPKFLEKLKRSIDAAESIFDTVAQQKRIGLQYIMGSGCWLFSLVRLTSRSHRPKVEGEWGSQKGQLRCHGKCANSKPRIGTIQP